MKTNDITISTKKILDTYYNEDYFEEQNKIKYMCKCGHKVKIPIKVDKQICTWCRNYVYKDPKQEFKEKLMKEKRKIERESGK